MGVESSCKEVLCSREVLYLGLSSTVAAALRYGARGWGEDVEEEEAELRYLSGILHLINEETKCRNNTTQEST